MTNALPLATMRPLTRAQRHLLSIILAHLGRAKSRLQVLSGMTTSEAFGGLFDRDLVRVDLVPEPRYRSLAQRSWAAPLAHELAAA